VDGRLLDVSAESREQVVGALAEVLHSEITVVFAYLHGSFATGGPFHDIDVAVFLDDSAVRDTVRGLDLGDRSSRATGYPVDVRVLNDASLAFQFRALQGKLLVVHDDEKLANFMERVGRLYLDIALLLRRATREAFVR